MKILGLKEEKNKDNARVSAFVEWEDCDRPKEEIYFETDPLFSDDISVNPDAFLIGCVIPAFHYGEKRIWMEGEICPRLRDGVTTVMSWLRHWYYPADKGLVRIEVKARAQSMISSKQQRSGFFFSGGVDSFATLRSNHLNYRKDHPGFIEDGLIVYGLELDDRVAFGYVLDTLKDVAKEIGLPLIPVRTNIYLNYRNEDAAHDFKFWTYEYGGAALAAVAHAFANRLRHVYMAATFDLPNLSPWGTHPLIDPNFSSEELRVHHDALYMSRLEKTRLIAEWDTVLRHLRVCNIYRDYEPGKLNCGRCEKCVRTKLELLALNALEKAVTFRDQSVSKDLILEKVDIHNGYVRSCYADLVEPLRQIGRHDLIGAIKKKIADYDNPQKGRLRSNLKRLDSTYLKGTMGRVKRKISSK